MMLRGELNAEPADEIELCFDEIYMVFLVRHQRLEQVASYIVLPGVAVRRGLLVERAGGNLRRLSRCHFCSMPSIHMERKLTYLLPTSASSYFSLTKNAMSASKGARKESNISTTDSL
jgi:hypothetical protein